MGLAVKVSRKAAVKGRSADVDVDVDVDVPSARNLVAG